jgi:Ca2+-binding EF-hand superfamily protein
MQIAGLLASAATVKTAIAQDKSQQDSAKREKNLETGEAEAKRMLILMDRDKNGRVSKQEFMAFMEAEFERMDVNRDGELDVKELTQFHVHGGVHR